jgi:hypothetical protein
MGDGAPRADNGRAYEGVTVVASRCGEGDATLRDSGFVKPGAGPCSAGDATLRESLRGVTVVAAPGCEGDDEDTAPREVGLA